MSADPESCPFPPLPPGNKGLLSPPVTPQTRQVNEKLSPVPIPPLKAITNKPSPLMTTRTARVIDVRRGPQRADQVRRIHVTKPSKQ